MHPRRVSDVLANVQPLDLNSPGLGDRQLDPIGDAASLPVSSHLQNSSAARFKRGVYEVLLGLGAAGIAVAARLLIGLPPQILPFFTVVIAVCLVTVATGLLGGLTTMIVGGLLNWYFFLSSPRSWALEGRDIFALLGYFAVTSVILWTSQMYRRSEQHRQAAALALAVQEAEQQRFFAQEMSHRLKNALTIVQAVAGQTFTRDSPEQPKFEGRLKALADAHNLLSEHVKQPTAIVFDVVDTAVRPFRDRADRFRLNGPPFSIPYQQVVSLSLALHELGTNAVKHGSLEAPAGWVSVDWRAVDGRLQLEWKEHGGAPVSAPSTSGFGSRLLLRSAMGAQLEFEPDGLRCTISQKL